MFDETQLRPDEGLGRRVSSRGHRAKVQSGNAPLNLFILPDKQPERHKISVDRLHDEYLADVSAIADYYFKHEHPEKRNFYGWAEVTQEKASELGRKVEPTPLRDNKYHADIVLPFLAAIDPREMERHATELAAKASWRDPL